VVRDINATLHAAHLDKRYTALFVSGAPFVPHLRFCSQFAKSVRGRRRRPIF
jgi:hypothetical protein